MAPGWALGPNPVGELCLVLAAVADRGEEGWEMYGERRALPLGRLLGTKAWGDG